MGPRVTGAEGERAIWMSAGHSYPLPLLSAAQLMDISKKSSPAGNSKCSVMDREIHVSEGSAICGGWPVEARFAPTAPEESRKAESF